MFAKKVKLDSRVILPLAMFALEPGPIIAQINLFALFCLMYLNDENTCYECCYCTSCANIVYNVDVNMLLMLID